RAELRVLCRPGTALAGDAPQTARAAWRAARTATRARAAGTRARAAGARAGSSGRTARVTAGSVARGAPGAGGAFARAATREQPLLCEVLTDAADARERQQDSCSDQSHGLLRSFRSCSSAVSY